MNILFALLFSILPVIIIIVLIYQMEEVKKQPLWILTILFISGILSWLLVRYVSNLLDNDIYKSQAEVYLYLGNIGFFLVSFGIIAVIEELSKYIIVNIFCLKNKYFTNPYDGIMYATCISLGFALVENIMYIMNYGTGVAFSRAIFSIPTHACFGIIMGYFLGLGVMCKRKKMTNDMLKMFYLSIFIPFIFHGLYDYICNIQIEYINIIFIIFTLIMYSYAIYLLIRLHNVDMKRINNKRPIEEEKRIYNPEKKEYRNIYYDLNKPKLEPVESGNRKESNWHHTDNNEIVYEDNSSEMNMFKNND